MGKDLFYRQWSLEGNVEEESRLAGRQAGRQGWLDLVQKNSEKQLGWYQSRAALEISARAKHKGIKHKSKILPINTASAR